MKKAIFFFLIMLTPLYSFSQIDGEDEVYLEGDKIDAKFKGDDTLDEFGNLLEVNLIILKLQNLGR